MTIYRSQRAYELFEQALERPADERPAFLIEACAGEDELRAEVEALLVHDSRVPDDFMPPPELELIPEPGLTRPGPTPARSRDPLLGKRIGGFLIQSVIGSGGMGAVYAAEQRQPHRTVALKIIKLGMDTAEVLARFEIEREALAMMNHPAIAKVFDAGATGQGRPYFAMEYVAGVPLTDYCDQHQLNIEQRLALFMQICDAVQHAHQKGVIHRDLKPSNILVEDVNGTAKPKIIDFGIAKALDQRLADRSFITEHGRFVGTPEYMSPEQAGTSGADIDTRADVYALGVLLYELMTGTRPLDLRGAAFAEAQRIIREVEPEKPSTRLSRLSVGGERASRAVKGESAAPAQASEFARSTTGELVTVRRSDPRTLVRNLRGDLDWIVMKCLEKDRTRRYETASALAIDIQRHLQYEPVVAGPPSAAYRVRKFVRRNRGPVLAAGLVALALVVGLIGTTTFAVREARQRGLAEQAEQRAKENEALAIERAEQTLQVAEFQRRMLGDIDAKSVGQAILAVLREQLEQGLRRALIADDDGGMRHYTADEIAEALARFDAALAPIAMPDVARKMVDVSILAPAVAAASEEFADQPQIEAQLLNTIGTVYAGLGQFDQAERHLRRALEQWRGFGGDEQAVIATGLNNLAGVLHDKGDYDGAVSLYREALALRRKLLGDEHVDVATSLNTLGWLLYLKGDYAAAEPLCREALALRRRLLGDEHPDVATSVNNLALLLKAKGEYDAAEPLYREALALRRKALGDEHPRVAVSLNNLAALLSDKGDYAGAEPLYREALAIFRKALGDGHPIVATSMSNLASLLEQMGDMAGAEALLREALLLHRKLLGDKHPAVAATLINLASLLHAKGDLAEAELLLREALAMNRELLGDQHPRVAQCLNNLAMLLKDKGDYATAESLLREALALNRAALGDEHIEVARNLGNLASLLRAEGDVAAAEPLFREALAMKRKLLGDEHPDVALSLYKLAGLLSANGDYDLAEPLYREALAICTSSLPAAHAQTADNCVGLARVLLKRGRFAEAAQLLTATHDNYTQTPSAPPPPMRLVLECLAEVHNAWHEAEPDKGHNAKAAEWRTKLQEWKATTQAAHNARP